MACEFGQNHNSGCWVSQGRTNHVPTLNWDLIVESIQEKLFLKKCRTDSQTTLLAVIKAVLH